MKKSFDKRIFSSRHMHGSWLAPVPWGLMALFLSGWFSCGVLCEVVFSTIWAVHLSVYSDSPFYMRDLVGTRAIIGKRAGVGEILWKLSLHSRHSLSVFNGRLGWRLKGNLMSLWVIHRTATVPIPFNPALRQLSIRSDSAAPAYPHLSPRYLRAKWPGAPSPCCTFSAGAS